MDKYILSLTEGTDMAGETSVDYDEWHGHAKWWDNEGPRIREHLTTSPEAIESAGKRFGTIGWQVRDALSEALQARSAAGHALGQYCQGVAEHIRSNVAQYQQAETANQQALSS